MAKNHIKRDRDPDWRSFEKAVARFAAAIAPDATVRHDVKLPDLDSGEMRQRDVWIDAKIGGLFPISVLVSCKRINRAVNSQDLDAFLGELSSSGAHHGAIFATSGFSKPALKKARRRGISCCRLYQNEPADLPEHILFKFFYCIPTVSLRWEIFPDSSWGLTTFDELWNLELAEGIAERTVVAFLARRLTQFHEEARNSMTDRQSLPENKSQVLGLRDDEAGKEEFRLAFALRWKLYEAEVNATLLDGGYSFTQEKFLGSQVMPWIDTQGDTPGPGWRELRERPTTAGTAGVTVFRTLTDVEDLLRTGMSGKPLDHAPVRGT